MRYEYILFDLDGTLTDPAIGINSIGVLFGYGNRSELEKAGADFIVDTVTDIGKVLCG